MADLQSPGHSLGNDLRKQTHHSLPCEFQPGPTIPAQSSVSPLLRATSLETEDRVQEAPGSNQRLLDEVDFSSLGPELYSLNGCPDWPLPVSQAPLPVCQACFLLHFIPTGGLCMACSLLESSPPRPPCLSLGLTELLVETRV